MTDKTVSKLLLESMISLLETNALFIADLCFEQLNKMISSTRAGGHRDIELFAGGQKVSFIALNAFRILFKDKTYDLRQKIIEFLKTFKKKTRNQRMLFLMEENCPNEDQRSNRKEAFNNFEKEIEKYYDSLLPELIKYVFDLTDSDSKKFLSALDVVESHLCEQDIDSQKRRNVFTGEYSDDIKYLYRLVFHNDDKIRKKAAGILVMHELGDNCGRERQLKIEGEDYKPDHTFETIDIAEFCLAVQQTIKDKYLFEMNEVITECD